MMIPRHELWRRNYRRMPYLKHLSIEDLRKHFWMLTNNSILIDLDGRITPDLQGDPESLWMMRITEVFEDLTLRGLNQEAFATSVLSQGQDRLIRLMKHPLKDRVLARLKSVPPNKDAYLVKYGQRSHSEELVKSGELFINPASSYKDPSLNLAIADDELSLEFLPDPSPVTIRQVNKVGKFLGTTIKPKAISVKFTHPDNYLVCCFSQLLTPRLFLDFDYDACVLIHDVPGFTRMILDASKSQLPSFQCYALPVQYYQPAIVPVGGIWVPIAKSISYAYQREYRFIWTPKVTGDPLAPLKLRLGDLSTVAELITV